MKEQNKERQELSELSLSFANDIKKFKEAIGSMPVNSDKSDPATNSQIQSCMNAMYSIASNLHDRMDRMQSSMYAYQDKHLEGHLPPCPSQEHMEAAIKGLGWDRNFEVKKKTIWASKDLFEIKSNKK